MKKIIFYITLILALPISLSAQINLTNAERRKLNSCVVDLLNDYELYLSESTKREQARYNFIGLFEDKNAMVYNDLLGLESSSVKELSLEKYADLMFSNTEAPKIEIKNVQKKDVLVIDNHVFIDVIFDKYIQYYNHCGIGFDSKEFYKTDHRLTATIVMDKNSGEVKIRTIKGAIDSDVTPLPEKYRVFQYNYDIRDKGITVNGQKILYNSFGQAIVEEGSKISINDYDSDLVLKINKEKENCNLYSFEYKHRRWIVKPKIDFSVGDAFHFEGLSKQLLKSESSVNWGIDVGYAIVAKPKFKMSLFTGIGMTNSSATFKGTYNYSYFAGENADCDGDSYYRFYNMSDLKAKVELAQITVPLYLDFDFKFSKRFSAYLQAGAKANLTSRFDITGIKADVLTYGIYPQYDGLKMENFVPNNFGQHSLNISEQKIEGESTLIDVFGGLGFRWNIYKGLYIDVGVTYQKDCTPIFENETVAPIGKNEILEDEAIMTFTCDDGENVMFTKLFEKITRNGLRTNIGLLLKF